MKIRQISREPGGPRRVCDLSTCAGGDDTALRLAVGNGPAIVMLRPPPPSLVITIIGDPFQGLATLIVIFSERKKTLASSQSPNVMIPIIILKFHRAVMDTICI